MRAVFYFINGVISVFFYFLNTVFWFLPIMLCSLIKLIPITFSQKIMSRAVDQFATWWIDVNNLNQRIFSRTSIKQSLPNNLSKDDWYLVIANHQSWVDILVLQRVFNRNIPFLKFFLKKNLIYVPFLGLAWWGLDFPFMQRYSKAFLQKNPHLKGSDLKATQKACKKFEHNPVSIMNFVEGTRFSEDKTATKFAKQLGLKRTLAPKSGGIAFVLQAMGNKLSTLLNVTIHYPDGIPSYWAFISGKVPKIQVEVEKLDIHSLYEQNIMSPAYFDDSEQRKKFQDWLNQLWQEKEQTLIGLDKSSKQYE